MKKTILQKNYLFFSIFAVVFPEIIFRATLGGDALFGSVAVFLCFSVAYGLLLYLLGTLFKNQRLSHILRCALLFFAAIPFLVWNFIYAQFRVLYDVDTTAGGALDAISGFSEDILQLICSVNGIVHIVLFLLPFFLYALWFRKKDAIAAISAKERLTVLVFGALFGVTGTAYILENPPLLQVCSAEYQFEGAVSNFGLYTGIGLDLMRQPAAEVLSVSADAAPATGEFDTEVPTEVTAGFSALVFDAQNAPVMLTAKMPLPEEPAVEAVDTSPNMLDLDFDALEANASAELAKVDEYVRSLTPTDKNAYTGLFRGKNLIFITAEAFSAEVIDPELTPTLYRLATKGINFTDYYQPAGAGTTGGEYANLMGMLPTSGGKSMKQTKTNHNCMTISYLLNREGYYGKAFHNNSYTYYDRNETHENLGFSDGFMGYGNGMEEYVRRQWPQSDLEMISGTLPACMDRQPFYAYYMSVSGHSNYSRSANAMSKKHWEEVEQLEYSDTVKAYLAAQLEFEAALAYLVDALEQAGIADDTVICIAADHFPYGLDHNQSGSYSYLEELYGYPVTNNFERDHNRLILWCGCLEAEEPVIVSSPTFSPDILPTLCNLFGIAYDSRLLPGRDALSDSDALVYDLSYNWKTDYGTYLASKGSFIPADEDTVIPDGYVNEMKQIVKNKINFSKKILALDYYSHVFPAAE